MSKGSRRRPMEVAREVYEEAWAVTFEGQQAWCSSPDCWIPVVRGGLCDFCEEKIS